MVLAFKKNNFTHQSAVDHAWTLKQTLRRAEIDDTIKVYRNMDNYCADNPVQIEKDYWVAEVTRKGVTFIN